jgi:hypothetical protein
MVSTHRLYGAKQQPGPIRRDALKRISDALDEPLPTRRKLDLEHDEDEPPEWALPWNLLQDAKKAGWPGAFQADRP